MKKLLAAAAFAASGAAVSADYELRKEKGECLHNNKFIKPIQYCHNCRKAGGNRIRWTFRVYCEDKKTEKTIWSSHKCGRKIPKEGEQSRKMYKGATEYMEELFGWTGDWGDCNLGDWPE